MRLPIIALATALLVSILPASTGAQTGIGVLDVWLKRRESADAPNDQKVTLYEKSKALVIAIDHYDGRAWPQLSNGIRDAEEVAKGLSAQGFEVTLKKDLKSTDLDDVLRNFFIVEGSDPNARLLLWFAGHSETIDGEAYLVPVDAPSPKLNSDFRLKAISLRRFGEYMREANAKHVLAIFDSCFSGAVFNVTRWAPPPAITLATTQPVREFISSGEAQQQVSDDGTFRKLFLDALAGKEPDADANHDGYVTGTELGLFLQQKMTNLTNNRQTPRYGKLNAYGYDRGDFVFQIGKPDATSTARPPAMQSQNEATPAWAAISPSTTSISIVDVAHAEKRVALVIGNAAYKNTATLQNPKNDANDIAASFTRLNFSVRKLIDGTFDDMRRALLQFGREAVGADMAVIYYSGHGMEIGGENWLIPIDAELQSDRDAENEAIALKSAMYQVANGSSLGLVILDACRNNPFAAKMQRSVRARSVDRGLVRVEPTDNVLVAYAAREGTVASDGDEKHSPFTAALLDNLETPGLEINFLFRAVRDEVLAVTKREQQPFVYGSLSKQAIYLKGLPAKAQDPAPTSLPALSEAAQAWAATQATTSQAVLEDFIRQFSNTPYGSMARARLEELKKSQMPARAAVNPAR
jgi:uncharacterized caspase-like protein